MDRPREGEAPRRGGEPRRLAGGVRDGDRLRGGERYLPFGGGEADERLEALSGEGERRR